MTGCTSPHTCVFSCETARVSTVVDFYPSLGRLTTGLQWHVCVPAWLHTSTNWSLWVYRRQRHFDWSYAHTCDCMIAHFNRGRFLSNNASGLEKGWHCNWLYVHTRVCSCTHFNSGRFLFNTLETHYRSAEGDNTSCMCRCTHVCVTVLFAHVSTTADFCPTKGELITGLQKAMTPWLVVQCTHIYMYVWLYNCTHFNRGRFLSKKKGNSITTGLQRVMEPWLAVHRHVHRQ